MNETGQSQLIFESVATGCVTTCQPSSTKKGNSASFYMPLPFVSASTFQAKDYPINSPVKDNDILSEDELEEQEWNNILRKPRVRRGLRRLAAEARRQIAAGEIEEGGFAIE